MKNITYAASFLIVLTAAIAGAGLLFEGYRRAVEPVAAAANSNADVPDLGNASVRTSGKSGLLAVRTPLAAGAQPPMMPEDLAVAGSPRERRLSVLQLGDSHTAADYFTGELRRLLQARYGDGGPGYVAAGRPYPAVRSGALAVATSPGWTYKSLQKSVDSGEFALSGFNASAHAPGQSMTFTLPRPLPVEEIQIEALKQPGGGSIEIKFDGAGKQTVDLSGEGAALKVFPIVPPGGAGALLRTVTVSTVKPGPVRLSSLAFKSKDAGLTYTNIGFIGATVHIVSRYDPKVFAEGLRRLNPNVVVLAFGSNEGFNNALDLEKYTDTYEQVVRRIRAVLPSAVIVLIAPPGGEYMPGRCRGSQRSAAVCRAPSESADVASPALSRFQLFSAWRCVWRAPRNLERVRKAQEQIAARNGAVYWDWSSIMPETCGSHTWAMQTPPLMAKDHLHLTQAGYRKSADAFSKTLIPILDKIWTRANVVSNN